MPRRQITEQARQDLIVQLETVTDTLQQIGGHYQHRRTKPLTTS